MSNPATAQQCALSVLRDQGIVSLLASPWQANMVQPTDIDAVALALTQAFQECAQEAEGDALTQPGSAWIYAPSGVTLTATQGSTAISAFATWASWMAGCTIRIGGDDQDNELLSATQLARPFAGTTGSAIGATVYCDCITIDGSVEKIIAPMLLSQNREVREAATRAQFLSTAIFYTDGSYQGDFQGSMQSMAYVPFWSVGPKQTGTYPILFFLDSYFDPALDHTTRRIRLTPMPTCAQSVGWTNRMTPTRVTAADIVSPLTNIAVTGATSDTNFNQTYTYFADFNGYRAYVGVTHATYWLYFSPSAGAYVLTSGFAPNALADYFQSGSVTSPVSASWGDFGACVGAVASTTTDAGGGAADPGTKINMPNGWVESIFLPVARQIAAGLPTFKNEGIRPEILRQYQRAIARLRAASSPSVATSPTRYL